MIGAQKYLTHPTALAQLGRDLLRPAGWRGKTPDAHDLDGSLIFERDGLVQSVDGTEIAYAVHGHSGPWVVLVPGFVCPDNFWRYLLPELAKNYRVIIYDLRGLGRSGTPREPGPRAKNLSPEDFSIPTQVRDLEAVMDAAGAEQAALIGHSMGGQIILQAYEQLRGRVTSLVMLTAPFESPIKTFYGRDFSAVFHAVGKALTVLPRSTVVGWRALLLANPPLTHKLAQLTRALGPAAKFEDMASYYRHMAYLDPLVILMMAEAMRTHSAADVLPHVTIPTLIVAGSRDTFTPVSLAEFMYATLPDSELVMIEGGSHGAVIEKPDEVNGAITSFLGRRLPSTEPLDLS